MIKIFFPVCQEFFWSLYYPPLRPWPPCFKPDLLLARTLFCIILVTGKPLNTSAASLEVLSELKQIEKIRRFLHKNLKGLPISEEDYYHIELSLLEICINIMRYAYPEKKGQIALKIWRQEDKVFLEIRDNGLPFDPTQSRPPDLHEIIRKNKKGGLGIFLSRELMDGFTYRRENEQNILLMYKKLVFDKQEDSI